jgi:conjugal transfer pilus assembly protein TraV
MNPYHDDFQCPFKDKNNGKCVSVPEAYAEAAGEPYKKYENPGNPLGMELAAKDAAAKAGPSNSEVAYKSAVYKKLTSLISDPQTPMVAPAQVARIMFVRYKGNDGELYMPRFVYFFLSDPEYVISEGDLKPEGE